MNEILLSIEKASQLRGIKVQTMRRYIRQYKVPAICCIDHPYETCVPLSYIVHEFSEGLKTVQQVKERGYIQVSREEAFKRDVICIVRFCGLKLYFVHPDSFYYEQYQEAA